MIVNDIKLDGYLFEDGDLYIGNRCLICHDGYYMIGNLHAYTSTEYCFKECMYYIKDDEMFIPFTDLTFKPLHWINRNAMIWAKSSKI